MVYIEKTRTTGIPAVLVFLSLTFIYILFSCRTRIIRLFYFSNTYYLAGVKAEDS